MKKNGFSLTEILIAMAIMGLIAVFTIPKVLNATKNSDNENWKRVIKQGIGEVESAYSQYRLDNRTAPPSTFTFDQITQYLNYVKRETVADIDGTTCFASNISCSNVNNRCYLLKNGAMLHWYGTDDFNNTSATNAIKFRIDPDAKVSGAPGQDPGKAVVFYLYYNNSRIRTRSQIEPNTYGGNWGPESTGSMCDPNWWSWN